MKWGSWSKWPFGVGLLFVAAQGLDFTVGLFTFGRFHTSFRLAATSWATQRRLARARVADKVSA
jgi:hypothetical protein